jgi:hypothetical protein
MADITYSGSLTFAKGNVESILKRFVNKTASAGSSKYQGKVQSVGTSREALDLGDVATPGFCIMHNLDDTNFILVYPDGSGGAMVKILPGEWSGPFRFAAAAPNVKADTAPCDLEFFLLPE